MGKSEQAKCKRNATRVNQNDWSTIMARFRELKVRVRLDKRRQKEDESFPLVASFSVFGSTALIPLGIDLLSTQWNDDTKQITNHPRRAVLNNYLSSRTGAISDSLLFLQLNGHLKGLKTPAEVKSLLLKYLDDPDSINEDLTQPRDTLLNVFTRFANSKQRPKTKTSYLDTLNKVRAFLGDDGVGTTFDELDVGWLRRFEGYLESLTLAVNSIAIHFRNLRSVCNFAIDEEITDNYPFRRFKIKQEATRKRSLSVEELRTFFNAPVTTDEQLHLDTFKLIFFLIGINMVDLAGLTQIENGRIEYRRSKTGKLYSIKVEPEALEIINKYRGTEHLLSQFDRYKDYSHFLSRCNRSLKKIGNTKIGKQGRRTYHPLHPQISTYWARHTWATIASKIGVSKDTIAHALGHGNNTVTDIYIDFDQSKVDRANRAVIDYVLYGKLDKEKGGF